MVCRDGMDGHGMFMQCGWLTGVFIPCKEMTLLGLGFDIMNSPAFLSTKQVVSFLPRLQTTNYPSHPTEALTRTCPRE